MFLFYFCGHCVISQRAHTFRGVKPIMHTLSWVTHSCGYLHIVRLLQWQRNVTAIYSCVQDSNWFFSLNVNVQRSRSSALNATLSENTWDIRKSSKLQRGKWHFWQKRWARWLIFYSIYCGDEQKKSLCCPYYCVWLQLQKSYSMLIKRSHINGLSSFLMNYFSDILCKVLFK